MYYMFGCLFCWQAVECGHDDCVKLLIEHNADVDAVDREGNSGLHLAVLYNHPKIIRLLTERGANVNKQNKVISVITSWHYTWVITSWHYTWVITSWHYTWVITSWHYTWGQKIELLQNFQHMSLKSVKFRVIDKSLLWQTLQFREILLKKYSHIFNFFWGGGGHLTFI